MKASAIPKASLDPHRNYVDTFITVASDSTAKEGTAPPVRSEAPTIPQLEFELLSKSPGTWTQQELQFAVHLRREGIAAAEARSRHQELWEAFFSKSHACLRASALPKKYGWGLRFDSGGRITLVPVESEEYAQLAAGRDAGTKIVPAMRSQRAR